ncbi:MAG: nucleotide exchange factor GrpE [archaeon]
MDKKHKEKNEDAIKVEGAVKTEETSKVEEIKEAISNAVNNAKEKILQKADEKDEKDKKIDELTDMLKRVQAEFINYKTRAEKENNICREYAKEDIVKKLLPILDSFELALRQTENKENFVKGMELIFSQLYNVLKSEGLEPIVTKDKKFDPYLHEVLLKDKSDMDSETITEELQKGYIFKEKVIRHSKVKIAQ